MSGPLARLLANAVIMGASIVSKAFVQAYQQAVVNAKQGGSAAQAARAVTRRGKMQLDEAMQILNFEGVKLPDPKLVEERFDKYFSANDPKRGGSFYLQSKIYRAKEAIDVARTEQEGGGSGGGTEKAKEATS